MALSPEDTLRAALAAAEEPDEPFELEVLTARATCELPDPPESERLLGDLLLRGGRLVLGGHTGEGKSTMAMQMVRAVVTGGEFLDWTGAGGRALVLDAEQGLRTVKRRLHEAGLAESDDVDYVRVPDGLALDSDRRHSEAVAERLAAGEYAVVLADPLYKLHTGDSNAEREAVDLMKRFDAWREEHRFGLILPVHCRKPPIGSKFSMHEFFGSSAYLRGAEVIVGVRRLESGYARLHFFKDRDGDLPVGDSWGLLFDREQGYRRDHRDGNRETAADKIRDALEGEPELTSDELVERTGYAVRTVRDALKGLPVDEHVGPRGKKTYRLTDDSVLGGLEWD